MNKKVIFGIYPLRYGDNNVMDAFSTKEIGFQLEVQTENSAHREILDLETVQNLKLQIENALLSYEEFMG
jgi:hypothetical protein